MENAMVEWYFNGRKLKTGVELTFEYLTNENEGIYECEVRNQFGSDRKTIEIDLESTYATELVAEHQVAHPSGINKNNQLKSINIQVLSNPQTDHIENGKVKIKCISGKILFI
jgi:hypothetical protein